MRKREYLILFFGFVLLVMLLILFFYPIKKNKNNFFGPGPISHNDNEFLMMMRDKLDLTDEQYVAITVVFKKDEAIRNSYREQIGAKLKILDELLLEDQFREKEVRKILSEIDSLKLEERILVMKKRYEVEKYLTAEQKTIMKQHMRDKMKRFRERIEPDGKRSPDND